jgi:hypothetical protein
MKAVKATYENGQVTLTEPPPSVGPIEVLVVFPEQSDDPWAPILADPSQRPELSKWITEIESEIAAGKTVPLTIETRSRGSGLEITKISTAFFANS